MCKRSQTVLVIACENMHSKQRSYHCSDSVSVCSACIIAELLGGLLQITVEQIQ